MLTWLVKLGCSLEADLLEWEENGWRCCEYKARYLRCGPFRFRLG